MYFTHSPQHASRVRSKKENAELGEVFSVVEHEHVFGLEGERRTRERAGRPTWTLSYCTHEIAYATLEPLISLRIISDVNGVRNTKVYPL